VSKPIAVVVDTGDRERAVEALRAAVGLTLRGDPVAVVIRRPLPDDPRIARAVATLTALGHTVDADDAVIPAAAAVEVWGQPGPRTLALADGRRLVYDDLDAADIVELVFAADGVVVA
jgi:hypothetical protein